MKKQKAYILVVLMHILPLFLLAQTGKFTGTISSGKEKLTGALVLIPTLKTGGISDEQGNFTIIDIKPGRYLVKISNVGYKNLYDSIEIKANGNEKRNYVLVEDNLNIEEIVVSGNRKQIERHNSPVIINTISNRTFEATQSLSIAEGLNFSPGLRVENNCQNCGFTQLRMNGLDGPYSQILINSRPVFSALAGVYGLEMLPTNMVDKIEVVRGGGSVLYGGNAIAGTVNIITKDPIKNSLDIGLNLSLINGNTPDRTSTINGAIVSDKLDKGISFFAMNRDRKQWDANGDGFSEMVQMRNNTFGFDAFWNLSERKKIKVGSYHINEFRRGGNDFELAPHQSDVAEQLSHSISSVNFSYEQYSKDYKHKLSAYSSMQYVERGSYYGAGGRVLAAGDSLTETDILAINAYGNSTDLSVVAGLQYNYEWSKKLMFIGGSEYLINSVQDKMPGYNRSIKQRVATLGNYAQFEIKPISRLSFLVGARLDFVSINGLYNLGSDEFKNDKTLEVFVPRITALYQIKSNLKFRASFAQGYRGPQAFDEDLHIETVGGAARFIRIDPNLVTEKSNSFVSSLNYEKMIGPRQMNFVLEGFYTELNNPFILSNQQENANGTAIITKRNGAGALVYGLNLEANIALTRKFILQSGYTIQRAIYRENELIWQDENEPANNTFSNKIMRTPNQYAFYSLVYNPTKAWSISYSGVITGSMILPHVINPETEKTVLKSTNNFWENNVKVSYTFTTKESQRIQVFTGIHNIFNSFQQDFDRGMYRDAGYVYGPVRPRTVFFGVKFGI